MTLRAIVTCLLIILNTFTRVRANCECGFTDEYGKVWQQAIIIPWTSAYVQSLVNITNIYDIVLPEYTVNASSTTVANRKFQKSNVVLQSDGLHLIVPGNQSVANGDVSSATMQTRRGDILFGSFRLRAQMPSPSGVCTGFFYYSKDNVTGNLQEIDVEMLSRNNVGQFLSLGQFPRDNTTQTFSQEHLSQNPSQGFNEFRIDWTPNNLNYLVNGKKIKATTVNVPDKGGRLITNVWSNGDPAWTAGPPLTTAELVVTHWVYFFNSSTSSISTLFDSRCSAALASSSPNAKCLTTQVDNSTHWGANQDPLMGGSASIRLLSASDRTSGSDRLQTGWMLGGLFSAVVFGIWMLF